LRVVPDHDLFFEFIPFLEFGDDGKLHKSHPTRHTLADVEVGVQYAVVITSCAGLWAYLVGDTVCFESRDPPLLRFTGRTKFFLSAFGEHLIAEEVDRAVTHAAKQCGVQAPEHHVGPVFPADPKAPGYHLYLVEFVPHGPADLDRFARELDAELCRLNEDYAAHRVGDLAMLLPRVRVVKPGGFARWMEQRGKLGGQNKVPTMDNGGTMTRDLAAWFETSGWLT
jgi:hypothetical protein